MTTETKKLEWETEEQPSATTISLRADSDMMFYVSPNTSAPNDTWHYFQLVFGRIVNRSLETGQKLWPREAIQIARRKLDALELQLDAAEE